MVSLVQFNVNKSFWEIIPCGGSEFFSTTIKWGRTTTTTAMTISKNPPVQNWYYFTMCTQSRPGESRKQVKCKKTAKLSMLSKGTTRLHPSIHSSSCHRPAIWWMVVGWAELSLGLRIAVDCDWFFEFRWQGLDLLLIPCNGTTLFFFVSLYFHAHNTRTSRIVRWCHRGLKEWPEKGWMECGGRCVWLVGISSGDSISIGSVGEGQYCFGNFGQSFVGR